MSPLEKLLAIIIHSLFFILAVLALALRYDWLPEQYQKPLAPYLDMLPKRATDASLASQLPSTSVTSASITTSVTSTAETTK